MRIEDYEKLFILVGGRSLINLSGISEIYLVSSPGCSLLLKYNHSLRAQTGAKTRANKVFITKNVIFG